MGKRFLLVACVILGLLCTSCKNNYSSNAADIYKSTESIEEKDTVEFDKNVEYLLQGTWVSQTQNDAYSEWTFDDGTYTVWTYVNGERLEKPLKGVYSIDEWMIHTKTTNQENAVEGKIPYTYSNGILILNGSTGDLSKKGETVWSENNTDREDEYIKKESEETCKYKYSDGSVCGDPINNYKDLCDYHFEQLNDTYNDYVGNSEKASKDTCKYKYSDGSVCGDPVNYYKDLCDYHFNSLNDTYNDYTGGTDYNYDDPLPDESVSDYIQRVDPDLYDSMLDNYYSNY